MVAVNANGVTGYFEEFSSHFEMQNGGKELLIVDLAITDRGYILL